MIQTSNRAALYARFSSDNQRSESIDAQIRAMTAYCNQHRIGSLWAGEVVTGKKAHQSAQARL